MRKAWLLALFSLTVTSAAITAEGPAYRVADLDRSEPGAESAAFFSPFLVEVDGVVYFTGNDEIHGAELWRTDGTESGTFLVRDICPGLCWSLPFELTAADGRLLFSADDGVHGRELWVSDGTRAGTRLTKDILPGLGSSRSGHLAALEGAVFFSASTPETGSELWRSDGTETGTRLVADILPGPEGSKPTPRKAAGELLFLTAEDPVHGRELWVSNGTEEGTRLVLDINPGQGDSLDRDVQLPLDRFAELLDGSVLFKAFDTIHGNELWRSDGTAEGTRRVKNIQPDHPSQAVGSNPVYLVAHGGQVYFSATDGEHGHELWVSDGTEAGTVLVEDIREGSLSSSPLELTPAGEFLFFGARSLASGRELWVSDGTAEGTRVVREIGAGPVSGTSGIFFGISRTGDGVLFFADNGVLGEELWKSDGSEEGTFLVADIVEGPEGSFDAFNYLGLLGTSDRSFFRVDNGVHGLELWTSDGTTAGTRLIRNILARGSSLETSFGFRRSYPTPLEGILVYACDDGENGVELCRSDGTEAGTFQVADLDPGAPSSWPQDLVSFGGEILFEAWAEGSNGALLHKTDGTSSGTVSLEALADSSDFGPMPAGDLVFFSGSEPSSNFGRELWATDGSVAGTHQVRDINPGPASSFLNPLADLGGELLFTASDGSSGFEPWKSDGTEVGTVRLGDFRPGEASSSPRNAVRAGARVFFDAETDEEGRELWVTDGTNEGTNLVLDLRPGPEASIPVPAFRQPISAALGDRLVFAAGDGVRGEELWISDGTAAGTRLLGDLYPGPRGSEPRELTAVEGWVYFVADDGVHGRELWITDGSESGTRLVRDLKPGPGSSRPDDLAALSCWLIFSADDGSSGVEAWVTRGTQESTGRVQDIAPGPLSSSPGNFTRSGDLLFFEANDNQTGFELWAAEIAPAADDCSGGRPLRGPRREKPE